MIPSDFVCFRKSLSYRHFWRAALLNIVFSIGHFFSFVSLNVLSYCLLDCKCFAEKSTYSLVGVPWYIINPVFLLLLLKFCLWMLIIIFLCNILWVDPLRIWVDILETFEFQESGWTYRSQDLEKFQPLFL